ncbi:MAG TPA: SPOR domain-containing protein, partial [Kiloniellales bacterium]|nr:SPOR domain-containing protein [Kiloniellales bacterium]
QRADLGDRGTFYRLRSSGSTRAEADRLCGALGSQGIDCIVVTVDSETLAEAHSDATGQMQ